MMITVLDLAQHESKGKSLQRAGYMSWSYRQPSMSRDVPIVDRICRALGERGNVVVQILCMGIACVIRKRKETMMSLGNFGSIRAR